VEHWTEYTRFFTALLVILDPFAALPIFLGLTQGYRPSDRARAAGIATLAVAAVLVLAALSGEALLHWMGTSLASFRVGGGIVLLLMALAMLRGQQDLVRATDSETLEAESRGAIAVVPVAIPLLAGPGAISTVIIEMHRGSGSRHMAVVLIVILVLCAVLWSILRLAEPVGARLGRIGLNLVNRLFGLVLTAIAVEIMSNGLRELFPVLGRVALLVNPS
jgi:multiple antibiotic resistance protein